MPGPEIPIHRPSVGAAELEAVGAVLESRWLGMGPVARRLEERLEELVGACHAVAVSSGSAALHLALAAHDVGPGDEVVLPSLTHVSCPQAVLAVGATPVFCDVEPATAAIDPGDVSSRLTTRTRALLPVHYAGFPCRLDELVEVAEHRDLVVVEDAAHAFGTAYGTRMIGAVGHATCFSFDPVKNITCGEGGAVTTDDDGLARRLRKLRNLGVERDSWARHGDERPWRYEATIAGLRYHLPDLNAAIGLAQLERFDELRARKRELLGRYRSGLAGVAGVEPLAGDLETSFPFLCVARVLDGRRDTLLRELRSRGIQAWVHYLPCHLQPAFAPFATSLPVTEHLLGELLSLPLHAGLTNADVDRVIADVREILGS